MGEVGGDEQLPTKVCGKCSVQSQTSGDFCPNCGRSYTRRGASRRTKWMAVSVIAVLLVGAAAAGIAWKVRHDNSVEAAEEAAAAEAHLEAVAEAQVESARDRRVALREEADRAERRARHSMVRQMQTSITKDAKKEVQSGTLKGPIYYTNCDPLGGGSTDDLTALTTTFECLAIHKKNGDGSAEGWVYSATANWNDGSYSWRLGR